MPHRPRRVRIELFIAALLIAACSGPNPVGSSDVQPKLVLEVPASLKVGLSKQMFAYVLRAGQRQVVSPTWTSSKPEVARVTGEDVLSPIAPGRTTLEARLETQIQRQDVSVVPDVGGSWTGRFRVADCRRESGNGSSPCRFLLGSVHPITLRITHDGEALSGSLTAYETSQPGTVDGTIDSQGQVVLSGRIAPIDYRGEDTLREWRMGLVEGELSASSVNVRSTFENAFGIQVLIEVWDVKALARSSTASLSVNR
jgi:hypothetical protein